MAVVWVVDVVERCLLVEVLQHFKKELQKNPC